MAREITVLLVENNTSLLVELRPDFTLSGAGRSGENVKYLKGPPKSAVRSAAPGRVFVTDAKGQVILDVTMERVKPVRPQIGFGEKRPPTAAEMSLVTKLWKK